MPDGSTYPQNSPDFEVDHDKLIEELTSINRKKDELSSASGDLRSAIKAILDDSGYHKTALSMIRQINDMPTTKKADCLRTFKPMFDAMYQTWMDDVEDMLDRTASKTSEMESDLA